MHDEENYIIYILFCSIDVKEEVELPQVLDVLNGDKITALGKLMKIDSKLKTKTTICEALVLLGKTK